MTALAAVLMASPVLPSVDPSSIPLEDVDQHASYLGATLDFLYFGSASYGANGTPTYPTLDRQSYSNVHLLLYNALSSIQTRPDYAMSLYSKLDEHIAFITTRVYEAEIKPLQDLPAEKFVCHYVDVWTRYKNRTEYSERLLGYLHRHWIKREEDEGRGVDVGDLSIWGYPVSNPDKEEALTSAKAAAEIGIAPLKALAFRKWRQQVVGKIEVPKILTDLQSSDSDQNTQYIAKFNAILLTTGARPATTVVESESQNTEPVEATTVSAELSEIAPPSGAETEPAAPQTAPVTTAEGLSATDPGAI